jgi:trk system potassium uptake protein TrkA
MEKKKVAVIGMGDFGRYLVQALYTDGHEIVVIDKNEKILDLYKDYVQHVIQIEEPITQEALASHGLETMDFVVIAVADSFESTFKLIDFLKNGMEIKNILVRYKNPDHKKFLSLFKLKEHEMFNPEEYAAMDMSARIISRYVRSHLDFGEEYGVYEIKIPESFKGWSPADKNFKQIYGLDIVAIMRKEKNKVISGKEIATSIFEDNDILLVFGKELDMNKFLDKHT